MEGLGINQIRAQQLADACPVIDIDWCEYCKWCNTTLALKETVRGATPKAAGVTTELARDARKKAFTVAYQVDSEERLTGVAVQQLHPVMTDIRRLTPVEWAIWLADLHLCHVCDSQPAWVSRAREVPFGRAA